MDQKKKTENLSKAVQCPVCFESLADNHWLTTKCCSMNIHKQCLEMVAEHNGRRQTLSRSIDRRVFDCIGCSKGSFSIRNSTTFPSLAFIRLMREASEALAGLEHKEDQLEGLLNSIQHLTQKITESMTKEDEEKMDNDKMEEDSMDEN